jgi:benzodiazapine receptor
MYNTNVLKNKILSFILFTLATYLASAIGGFATITFKEPWYSLLIKPSFNPPDWIFAPVWTTLYLMMTIAIWIFWHSKNRDMKTVYIYLIHLIFNTTWSLVFFVLHKMILALLILIILIYLIIILILRFKRVNLLSSYMMIPYLLWCTFALFLNISLIILN